MGRQFAKHCCRTKFAAKAFHVVNFFIGQQIGTVSIDAGNSRYFACRLFAVAGGTLSLHIRARLPTIELSVAWL